MNKGFSLYLTKIGLLDETTLSMLLEKENKSNNKSFKDISFNFLMRYFNNLSKEQKKNMSFHIPSNFISISEKLKKDKIKSILIHQRLRQRLILLKYLYLWKLNISFINNIKINSVNYKDNISLYNLINIDNNVDIDNKNFTKSEEDDLKNKNNQSSQQSLSFADFKFKNSSNKSKKKFLKIDNNQKINNYFPNSKNNKNNLNRNRSKLEINPYNFSNNKIKLNKTQFNINSYKSFKNKINNSKNKNYNDKNNNDKNNNNNNNNNSGDIKSHLLTSLEEKEMKELEECIFKPKINNKRKNLKNYNSLNILNSTLNTKKRQEEIQLRFEKLYKDNEKYKLTKQLKAIELEHIASRRITFAPNLKTQFKEYLNKYKLKSEGNFEERQKKYLIRKNQHSAELKKEINSFYETICSFNPKITMENGEYYPISNKEKINDKPVFMRLYKDGKKRQNLRIQNEVEKINKIVNLSNILNPKKKLNCDTIEKLYRNREHKNNIIKTKKKVEEEEGTTFKPNISENYYSRSVNGTFYERNEKFINDKESFYEEENKKFQDDAKKKFNRKEFTKKEKKQIINNIIKRLYNDSVNIKRRPIKVNEEKFAKSFYN